MSGGTCPRGPLSEGVCPRGGCSVGPLSGGMFPRNGYLREGQMSGHRASTGWISPSGHIPRTFAPRTISSVLMANKYKHYRRHTRSTSLLVQR